MDQVEQQPIVASKKRPRSTSEATAAVLDPAPEAPEAPPPQVDPTTIFNNIPNASHLASINPKLALPQTQIRNVMKKAAAGFSNRPDAVYLVSKAAECLLTEILTAAIATIDNTQQEQQGDQPSTKRHKLTYGDIHTAFESLKQKSGDGVTPDLSFLNKILPPKGQETTVMGTASDNSSSSSSTKEATQ